MNDITFDEEIIASEKLQVPHPEMQNRLFVLLPINDLQLDFIHPIFEKTISVLIDECEDKSDCKIVSNLELPSVKAIFDVVSGDLLIQTSIFISVFLL